MEYPIPHRHPNQEPVPSAGTTPWHCWGLCSSCALGEPRARPWILQGDVTQQGVAGSHSVPHSTESPFQDTSNSLPLTQPPVLGAQWLVLHLLGLPFPPLCPLKRSPRVFTLKETAELANCPTAEVLASGKDRHGLSCPGWNSLWLT